MSVRGNFPTFKYITVENLVITHNGTPYPVKNFYTNKKYVVWNVERQYQLEDTNIRPENSLLEYLVVINDNGKPTIVNHDELTYSFDQLTTGGSSSGEYNALKEKVDANTKKYNTISNTVDGMTQIIGSTGELKDGSIIYNLNKVKSDSKSYEAQIEEIKTKIDDKYKELRPILLSSLVEYLRTVSEYKLSFTDLKEDIKITSDELNRINNSKTDMMSKLELLNANLDSLIGILEEVNDSTNIQTITNTKSQLSILHNALISLGENALLNNKLEDLEKTNIIQKAYELSTYVGTVQNTCNNITVNGLGGVIYSVENELLMLKDSTTNSIKELNRNGDDLEQKYTSIKQTTESIVEEVGQLTNRVGDLSSTSKKTIRSVVTYYTLSSSNSEIVGYDFSNIKPGDIIFQGNKDNGRYKGVYHVSIFYGLHDGENYVIEFTSKSDVKKHKDDKTCGLCLRKWENVKKSDIVCIARPNSSSGNRVFNGASEFLTLAKAYYDKREQYFTYSQCNLWTDNSSKSWIETTTKGIDSPDGLYRHLDCSGYLNLVMRGIPFEEVFTNESVFNARDLSKRTNYDWTNELPRLASEQCQEVENLGWDLRGSELHSVNNQWYTSVPENPNNFYIWSKNITTYVDGTTLESEITCLSNDLALDGRSIVDTTPYYYESYSNTETIDGNWTTIPPRWTGDKYVWTKSLILYDDDTTDWTPAVCVGGTSPISLTLDATSYVVAYDSYNIPKSNENITLTATQTNFDDEINWFVSPNTVALSGTGKTRTISPDSFKEIDKVSVTIQSKALSNTIMIVKVKDGAKGQDGTSVKILGSYETEEKLNLAHPSGNELGDGYMVGKDLYVWNGSKFENVGQIKGEDGVDGVDGANGVDGQDGVSILWQGTLTTHPSNPQNGWAYYNSTDGKSYTYRDNTWYQMTVDGKDGIDGNDGRDGTDGLSIDYRGELSSPPSNPIRNWVYRDSDNGVVYIYTGTAWEVMTYDGTDGADGSNGTNGVDGTDGLSVFITYHDNLTKPSTPIGNGTSNGWHTNCTDAVVWMSQKVAMTSTEGTWGTPVKIKGQDGKDGTSVTILGTYNSLDELNATHGSGNNNGDGYIIQGDLYVWDGTQFLNVGKIKGEDGTNGVSSYIHIKYSNDGGNTFTPNNGEDIGEYIGTCVDYDEIDPSSVSAYKWAKFLGDKGEKGDTGNGVENIVIQYAKNQSTTVEPTSGWSTNIPTYEKGYYLWYRTRTKYTNNTDYVYSTATCDISWKSVGDILDIIGDWSSTETISESFSNVTKKVDSITQEVKRNSRVSQFRYIRDYVNGNTFNNGSHWVEIQVYKDNTNIAKGKNVTCSGTGVNLNRITDGSITSGYAEVTEGIINTSNDLNGYKYVQVDLGQVYTNIQKIKIWHYYDDNRAYYHKLEVSKDGNEWFRFFDSDKNGLYQETVKGKTYIIDDSYSESQFEQTADKFSWIIKSGISSSSMVFTDDFYSVITENIRLKAKNISLEGLVTANSKFKILTDGSMEATNGKFDGSITGGSININNIFKVNTSGKLTATGADIGGKITITDGSISLNNGAFVVNGLGNTKIGGDSAVTTDGYLRALCEITSNGTIFSCSSTDSSVYTRITEGKINVYAGDIITTVGDSGIKVSDGSTATTYGDGYISHNLSIMVDTPILNCTQSVYANEFRGQGNCVMKAPTGSGVYLLTNGASIGDDESTNGVKTIRYFKNTNGDYVFRTNSLNGSCYNGTSSYPWKQVAAKEFKNTSDRTLKENIVYLSNSSNYSLKSAQQLTVDDLYNFVKNDLSIAMYNYIDDDSKKIGFIAQDIIYNADETDNAVGQLIVNPRAWNEEEEKLTYDVNNYISVLAGALQMTMKKIDILEGKINGN